MIDLAPLLKSRQISQTELANRLGVSRGYMSLLVNGQRDPSPSLLQRIAAELSVPVGDLFEDTGFAEPEIARLDRAPKGAEPLLQHARRSMGHPALYRANCDFHDGAILRGDLLIVDLKAEAAPGDLVACTFADPQTGATETTLRRWYAPWLVGGETPVNAETDDGSTAILGIVSGVFRANFLSA